MSRKKKKKEVKNKNLPQKQNFFNLKNIIFLVSTILIIFFNNKYLHYINKFTFLFLTLISLLYIYSILNEKYNIKKLIYIGVIILVIFKIFTFYSPVEINGDNANYIIEGKSLAIEGVPKKLYEPYSPVEYSLYNIGIIIIFAFLYKITGGIHPLFFKIVFASFSIFSFLLLYKLFSIYFNKYFSLAFSFIISLHQQLIHFSSLLLTETPFLFFALLTLYFSILNLNDKRKNIFIWIVTGIILFFTTMIRNAGLLFIGLLPFAIFLKGKQYWKKAIIIFTTAIILLSLWIYGKNFMRNKYKENIYQSTIISSNEIIKNNKNFIVKSLEEIYAFRKTYLTNFFKSIWIIGQKIIGEPDNVSKINIFAFISGLIILTGLIFDILKRRYLFASFFLSIFILIILRFGNRLENVVMSRYYFAIIPFAYYYFYIGIIEIISKFKNKNLINISNINMKNISIVLLLFFLIVNLRNLPKEVLIAKEGYPPVIKNFVNLAKWIKNNIKDNVIIGNRKPTIFYLYSNKKSILYYKNVIGKFDRQSPWSQELENETLKMYKEIGVDFIVLDSFSSDPYIKLLPIIQHHPDIFTLYYFPSQFNIPAGYIKTIPELFEFINNYYRKTHKIFIPTTLIKINKEKLKLLVTSSP